MSKISIVDLEVHYRVGVPDEERARPQRLLLTVDLEKDFAQAILKDDLGETIDYWAVAQWLLGFGEGRSWKLIEKLAADIADTLLAQHDAESVRVEIKKFVLPEARHVAVSLTRVRGRNAAQPGKPVM